MLTAIIVAAGSSRRVGFDKLLAPIAGRTVIGHTLAAFQNCAAVNELIVVVRPDRLRDFDMLLDGRFNKLRRIVPGGEHRQDSVAAGLAAIVGDADFIAVHDAARPLVTPQIIEAVLREAREHGAAAAAEPVTDTVKRATRENVVSGAIEREGLYAMQTPQIFARDLLLDAYRAVASEKLRITDDVSAVEHLGRKVVLVPTEQQNFKITYREDLGLAACVLTARTQA